MAIAVGRAAARARGGPGRGLLRRDPGLSRPRDAERRRDARRTRLGSSTGWSASSSRPRSSAPGASRPWRTPRSTSCWPRGAGRSSSAGPASTCAPLWPTSTCARRCPPRCATRSSARSPSAAPRRCTPSSTPTSRPTVHPNDRKRIARVVELQRAGIEPPRGERAAVDREAAPSDAARRPGHGPRGAGAPDRRAGRGDGRRGRRARRRARAAEAGASRTARAALGFDELLDGRRRRRSSGPTAPTPAASSPGCAGWRASS